MHFLLEGPDIPDALVLEQERGGVVFVCGAGVSMTAGLPSFATLVDGVYLRLGEDWRLHHAEREVMARGGRMAGQYDRALRCLERRLAAHDVRQASGLRRRIRGAVDEQLRAPSDAELSNHLALLELSRGPDNASRLLTTNFDCLFERAWRSADRLSLPSHAGPAMPRPGTAAFEGVLHLHGRIADGDLPGTDLVLTSAEFGEAYLRSGWAARYVYDLARAGTLVLVGYQADDPPMRYLLEVLEDDRARYPDLRQVYAFAPAASGSEDAERAMWAAKGIEPVLYQSAGPADHASLYSSLRAWRDYAVAPGQWRGKRLRELLAGLPEEGPAANEAVALLSREDAPTLLFALAPDPAWWPVLSTRPSLRDCPGALRAWITVRAGDPAMLQACVADRPAGSEIYDGALLSARQGNSRVPGEIAGGWRLLARAAASHGGGNHGSAWFAALERIRDADIDHAIREVAVDVVRPQLRVSRVLDWPGAEQPSGSEGCYRVEFQTNGDVTTDAVLQAWPHDTREEAALLRLADRALAEALDLAVDAGYQKGFDRAGADVKSFSGPASLAETGFSPLARLVAALWDRVATVDSQGARALASAWNDGTHPLRRRLHLHALARPGVLGGAEAWEALSKMDDTTFWTGEGSREVASVLAARWAELTHDGREALQVRILRGPPRELFQPATEDTWWHAIYDHLVFRLLEPIRRAGGLLSEEAGRALADLVSRHPNGSLTLPEEDDDHLLHSGFMDIQDQAGRLDGVADDALVPEALRATTDDWFRGSETWRRLCDADPMRALRGAVAASVADRARQDVLVPLLSAACDGNDSDLQEGMARLLLGLPSEALSGHVAAAAARWIWQRGDKVAVAETLMPDAMLEVWDKVADGVLSPTVGDDEAQSEATLEEALNAAGGIVALALLSWIGKARWAVAQCFPQSYSMRLDRLASAPGRAGLHARVLLVRDLTFLHDVDPAWTERMLVPRMSWTNAEASTLWLARAGRKIGRPALFNALKPAFLEAVCRADDGRHRAQELAVNLVEVARWKLDPAAHAYQLEWTEVRSTLSRSSVDVRKAASWALWRWAANPDEAAAPAVRWRSEIGPLFELIWPLDAAARDARSSRNLASMTLECGDAFPEAVDAVEDFIVPFEIIVIDGWLRSESRHREAASAHPGAFLRLLDRAIGPRPGRIPTDLRPVLDACLASDPGVASEPAFGRLDGLARRGA